jgi:hypothetical protein
VQRDGLHLIARCRPENLIITPTGSGKTIPYVAATPLPRVEATVVIVPLIALRQDLLRRCEQWGIPFRRRRPGSVACGAVTAIRGRLQRSEAGIRDPTRLPAPARTTRPADTKRGASPANCVLLPGETAVDRSAPSL